MLRARIAEEVRLSPISNFLTYSRFLWAYLQDKDMPLEHKLVRILQLPLSVFVNLSALLGAEPSAIEILRKNITTNPVHLMLFLHASNSLSGDRVSNEWSGMLHDIKAAVRESEDAVVEQVRAGKGMYGAGVRASSCTNYRHNSHARLPLA